MSGETVEVEHQVLLGPLFVKYMGSSHDLPPPTSVLSTEGPNHAGWLLFLEHGGIKKGNSLFLTLPSPALETTWPL